MQPLNTDVADKLKYYVYALADPNGKIFYIGKGKGNRVFDHVRCALNDENKASLKLDTIRQLGPDNVRHFILRHGLDEQTAFIIESVLIDVLNSEFVHAPSEKLTNIQSGHHPEWDRGIQTIEDILALYNAPDIVLGDEPLLFVNLPRSYTPGGDFYNAAKGDWCVGEKCRKPGVKVLAVYQGVVRAVYENVNWGKQPVNESTRKPSEKRRWAFEATLNPTSPYLNTKLNNSGIKFNRSGIAHWNIK